MKKFNITKIAEKEFRTSKRVDIQISAKDNGFLKPIEVKYLLSQFEKKYPNNQFLVKGLGVAGLHELGDSTKHKTSTLKPFGNSFNFQDEEEYLDGRVRDTTKFLQYFQITISVVKPEVKKVQIKMKKT